jgi:hypothetical protein
MGDDSSNRASVRGNCQIRQPERSVRESISRFQVEFGLREGNNMFGIGAMELLILGAICVFFIVAIVAVVVIVVTMSNKKSKDE